MRSGGPRSEASVRACRPAIPQFFRRTSAARSKHAEFPGFFARLRTLPHDLANGGGSGKIPINQGVIGPLGGVSRRLSLRGILSLESSAPHFHTTSAVQPTPSPGGASERKLTAIE